MLTLLDSIAPCCSTLSSKIDRFFVYITDLLIFSKRVRGEMSFQRGKTIMALTGNWANLEWYTISIFFGAEWCIEGGDSERCLKWGGWGH